jgi:hypothetical protein
MARRPEAAKLLELLDAKDRATGERHLATLANPKASAADRAGARAWLDGVTARVLEQLEGRGPQAEGR